MSAYRIVVSKKTYNKTSVGDYVKVGKDDSGKYLLFRCYEQNLNKIIYDLLEVEDAHR